MTTKSLRLVTFGIFVVEAYRLDRYDNLFIVPGSVTS